MSIKDLFNKGKEFIKLAGKKIRPPDINIDPDFFSSGRSVVEMNKAQQAYDEVFV